MFEGFPFTVDVDHITRNALASCYSSEDNPTEDHSFFHRLSYTTEPEGEKVWIIQELSSFLATDPMVLEKQLADLRAAHVGKHSSHGGMGGTRVREIGQFGMVVGTTEAFEVIRAKMSTFGDRFLSIRMSLDADTPESMLADSATAWSADPARMLEFKKRIKDATHSILTKGIDILRVSGTDVPRSEALERVLTSWSAIHSTFATLPISSNILATRAGRPFRIVEQVKSWGNTHAVLCGREEWGEDEMRIARRLFQDSMARTNYDLLHALWPRGIQSASGNMDVYRQWGALGAVETMDGRGIEYGKDRGVRLTEAYRHMIGESGYFDVQ